MKPGATVLLAIGLSLSTARGREAATPCELIWRPVTLQNDPGSLLAETIAFDERRGVAVLFGGEQIDANLNRVPMGATWELSGAKWTQRETGSILPRAGAAMAYDSTRGVCVLFGGSSKDSSVLPYNDLNEWDGTRWRVLQGWNTAATNQPPPIYDPVMAYDSGRRRMVLLGSAENTTGNVSNRQPISRTWEWDGSQWHVYPTAPPARRGAKICYDSARRQTIFFGGAAFQAGTYSNDTWAWDGTNWTQVATQGPPGRDGHAMAFDKRRNLVVLTAGGHGSLMAEELFGDTWEWNGRAWSLQAGAPVFGYSARTGPSLWFDTTEQRLLVFGGFYQTKNNVGIINLVIPNDLWEGRPPGLWMDYTYTGNPAGTFYAPYKTLSDAVNAADPGCTIIMKTGSPDPISISKPVTIETYNAPITIGRRFE